MYFANLTDDLTSISPPHFNLFEMNRSSNEDLTIPLLVTFDDIKDSGFYPTDNSDVSYILKDVHLSILNKSAMNDTLYETRDQSSEETGLNKAITRQRVSSRMMKAAFKTEEFPIKETLISPTFQRSFSEGDQMSPKKLGCRHARSIIDSLMYNKMNVSIGATMEASDNGLNAAFIQSKCSSSNSLTSNKSFIRRLNSVASISSISPSITSNSTMNKGFLGSWSLLNSSTYEEKVHSATRGLSDLIHRFYRLKAASMEAEGKKTQTESVRQNSVDDIREKNIVAYVVNSDDNKYNKPPVFEILPHEHNESYSFNHSSDSVFEESKNVNQLILGQAIGLAKMFEELAQTESFSNADDLLVNNPLWTSELVPEFEDEVVLDNIIELPLSPTSNVLTPLNEHEQIHEGITCTIKSEHCANSYDRKHAFAKDLEADFQNPIASEANVIRTLLLDLKRSVKTMKNSEANELLENLERVLGVEGESNVKLSSMRPSAIDDLKKSPCKLKLLEGTPAKKQLSPSHMSPSDLKTNISLFNRTSKSRLSVTENRFPSTLGFINFPMDKKEIYISNDTNKENDTKEDPCIKKTDKVLDLENGKSSMISKGGKSKLKHKLNRNMQRKNGPVRAVLPLKNMHRRGSLAKEVQHSMESVTPPNFKNTFIFTLTSSTPIAVDNESTLENTKSKPIASSTPNNGKRTKSFERLPSKRHSITCDISPVTMHDNVLKSNSGTKNSLNTDYKWLSPRRTWCKDRQSEFCIPKYSTSPIVSIRNSTGLRRSPQCCSYSPNSIKRIHKPQVRRFP